MAALNPQANGPKSQVTHQATSKGTANVPFPLPLQQLSFPPGHFSVPTVGCSEPSAAQYLSVFSFVASDLAGDSSLRGPFIQQSAVPSSLLSSTNLIHMLSVALAKPLIKMTGKERAESRAQRPCLLSATVVQRQMVADTPSGP